jgi:hypothetical protein
MILKFKYFGILISFPLIIVSCSSAFLRYEKMEQLKIDEEVPVVVKEISSVSKNQEELNPKINKNIKKLTKKRKVAKVNVVSSDKSLTNKNIPTVKNGSEFEKTQDRKPEVEIKRLPDYESSVGFAPGSRRPIKDPFRVGEKVTLMVSYFKAKAGEMTLEVHPFVEVNGVKSYRWYTSLKTVGVFSSFYSIEDWAETMASFESLVPSVFTLNVKESSQLKQAKGYFNNQDLKTKYYEKKYTEKKGQEEKRQEWLALPFSQNVFSAAFYMRVFNYEVGKEYSFNVADDEKNVLFKAKCLRKEKLETDAGIFDTIVIQPTFEINGVFKPMGEVLFWLSDDDRKFLLRIESDIKIGTIVGEALTVIRGEN